LSGEKKITSCEKEEKYNIIEATSQEKNDRQ
jgi:hypothetical protein